jgi:predicted aspartyl protease
MPQNKIVHRAFKVEYPGIVREIFTKIHIHLASSLGGTHSDFKDFMAIWDTGASGTVITSRVVQALGLVPFSKTKVFGVNSEEICNVYLVDIGLPNRVVIENANVMECKINSPNVDVLIGMDIIQLGDFSISNPNGKTVFSYCTPPHKNPVDLVAKSNSVNPKPMR